MKRIRRGTLPSTRALISAICEYLDATNSAPRPFVWTATANGIVKKVRRGKAVLETLH